MSAAVAPGSPVLRSQAGNAARWGWWGSHPLAACWGGSLLLALLSGVLLPTIPSYDPFSWVVWGHAVTAAHIPFYVGGGPSWKPLPFLFTTVYGLFGGAAPWLWVVTARVGAFAGLFGAVRIVTILSRRAGLPAWGPWIGGLVAVGGIVLTWTDSPWSYYFMRGTSEVLLVGVWLWALERMILRRHLQAFAFMAAEGLMRPEAWPFLFVYGAYLFLRHPRTRIWVVLGLLAQPAGWFGPPWYSTGDPFLASTHAADYNGHLGSDVLATIVHRGIQIQPLPTLVLALVAAAIGLWLGRRPVGAILAGLRRPRSLGVPLRALVDDPSEVPLVLALALGAAGWWVVVIVETLDGYPGLERFYLPAAVMIAVLSGYAVVRIGAWVGSLVPASRAASVRFGLGALVGLALCAACVPTLDTRVRYLRKQPHLAHLALARVDDLGRSIARLGGMRRVLPCAKSTVVINHSLQTAMAFKLGTTLERVSIVLRRDALAWVGPKDSVDGAPPIVAFRYARRVLFHIGAWRVEQIYHSGSRPDACTGS